jgi:cytochrome c oxidase subunit 2
LRTIALLACLCLPALLPGCSGEQSALAPRGEEAIEIGRLFWTMTIFLALVLLGVFAATVLAIAGGPRVRARLTAHRFIVGAGVVFPAASLLLLLGYGLSAMSSRAWPGAADPAALRMTVVGEQWWWRVIYHLPDGTDLESANELVIPVGERVALSLRTADVIHSFWVPSLAGKVDMIPGRVNRLALQAARAGVSRGQCAEYCGGAHALMSFHVVARERTDFDEWLRAESRPATRTDGEGARLFVTSGCGACHRIRGLPAANGRIGPDLTHVASRRSLAAATLRNDAEAFAAWIRDNQHIKPGNRMPPYHVLTDGELGVLARYLDELE